MSNFEYLCAVNAEASRSVRVFSQYPVFPWVLNNYTSPSFRVNDLKLYGDMTLPIGCQGGLTTDADAHYVEKGIHSNFYLSSPSIVTRALVRLNPYAE